MNISLVRMSKKKIRQSGFTRTAERKRQTRRISLDILKRFRSAAAIFPEEKVDGKQNPDIVPIAAALACAAKGRSTIVNSSRLRFKESDRLAATSRTLNALGASIEKTKDGLYNRRNGSLKGGRVGSFRRP